MGLGNFIQLWDLASRKIRATVIGAAGQIEAVAFDREGERIACGGADETVRIWKLAR